MPQYRMRPAVVDAFQYTGQVLDDLPEWLRSHQSVTEYGTQPIGRNVSHELLVPIGERIVTVKHGGFVTRDIESGAISAHSATTFHELFEPVSEAAEIEG